ncbi:DUF3962 domain-containing protein [Oscillatoria sp. FACHB-1406]|uniref:pPIWI_RE module domain-containing protein n=1 Tax=Oscillatoria sp. FACHB-1406 TaxID=2692846 RepID=UPI001686A135|nr:DUF3962 domain-containing protein [Oscillatoria sp. FACHB-1406]MBD2580171.1 DUF3962 domain-containing protein [Oscillatoria sp. FACHB-1406]
MTSKKAQRIILPSAWELTEDAEYELFSLSVPTLGLQAVKALAERRYQRSGKGYRTVPVRSLDRIIAASFPNIIQTARKAWKDVGTPWIFTTEMGDLTDLPDLIKDWLLEEFGDDFKEEVEPTIQKLERNAWQWGKSINYHLLEKPDARSFPDFRFQVIPHYLAERFINNPTVKFGDRDQHELTFYRVVRLEGGAELISWPPQRVFSGNQNEAYLSFVLNFKLQTVPWRELPLIYPQLSVRRWIVEPFKKYPYRGATVYVGDNRRWLDGERQPFRLMPLKLTTKGQKPQWPRAISNLLELNDSPLPDINTLTLKPGYNWSAKYIEPTGIQAAIAYDNRWGKEPCKPGVSPRDLYSLDRAICDRIEQGDLPLARVGEAPKIGTDRNYIWGKGESKSKEDKTPKKRQDVSTVMLRPNIAAPATFRLQESAPQTILILWETEKCRDALIEEICETLDLSPPKQNRSSPTLESMSTEAQFYTIEELICQGKYGLLTIKTQHVEELTQKLDLDRPGVPGKNRQQKRVHLIEERVLEIADSLPKPEGLSGAIVEIKGKNKFFPRESDPKLAVRIGVMKAGYVNQHINPLTDFTKERKEYSIDNPSNRVQRAVSDLLRQFGVLPVFLIDRKKDTIDANLWLTCFYVLRRTRKTGASNQPSTIAIVVRVNPITGSVEMTTLSLFPERGWVPYSVGLGYLVHEKWEPNSDAHTTEEDSEELSSKEKQKEQNLLNRFVVNCLRDCLNTPIANDTLPRVLFMAEAQNARQMLTWLRNPNLPANDLPNQCKRDMKPEEIKRLWMVRLRVADKGEVPVGIVKDSPGSRTSSAFRWQGVSDEGNPPLYFSVRLGLTTEKYPLKKSLSRLDNGEGSAANRRLLEIAIVHCPGIDSDKLADFVHHLRSRWPYFADEVSLPFPFPFACLAKEYAVSARDIIESDSEESESEE